MFGLGIQELMMIFLIAMVLFGGKKLPEIGQGLGKGIREFKRALERGATDEEETAPKKGESTPLSHPAVTPRCQRIETGRETSDHTAPTPHTG